MSGNATLAHDLDRARQVGFPSLDYLERYHASDLADSVNCRRVDIVEHLAFVIGEDAITIEQAEIEFWHDGLPEWWEHEVSQSRRAEIVR